MKQIHILSTIFVTTALFVATSCEKVIDITTNNSTPQLVVEGNVSNSNGPHTVKLSTSVNYDESNNFPPVQNALVIISDDIGHSEALKETSAGIYQTSKLKGTPGYTYTLYIKTTDKKEYTATSTMPALVPLERVDIERLAFSFDEKDTLDAVAVFHDPPGLGNNYRFVQYINKKQSGAVNVTNDKYFDGNPTRLGLYRKDKEYIKTGDEVSIEMRNIDKANYDYFNTLNDIINNLGNTAPANPISSFTGGALGYFCAYSATKQTVIVTE